MMESENSQLLSPHFNDFIDLSFEENFAIEADYLNVPHLVEYSSTSSPFSSIDESPFTPSMWLNDDDSTSPVEFSADQISLKLKEIESILDSEDDCSSFSSSSSHQLSIEAQNIEWSYLTSNEMMSVDESLTHNVPLIVPTDTMEIDMDLSLNHLVKAYAEAKEMGQIELAEVIARHIRDKVRPIGGTMERGLYYFFNSSDNQADYVRQESVKNFGPAFNLFYKLNPCGMVAHFTANSIILEAMPQDAESIHIIDFDMGEGLQWHSFIESVAQRWQLLFVKPKIILKLIKWGDEDNKDYTKLRLYDHARSLGLNLEMREVGLMNLQSEIRWTNGRCGRREWLAFNCMVGLPHMARRRPRIHALEFLRIAKESLVNNVNGNYTKNNDNVVIFADGDGWMNTENNYSGFSSVFEKYMEHAMALMESLQMKVPSHLAEARLAMEWIFLAPLISYGDLSRKLEEIKERFDMESGRGWKLSSKCFLEARELVRGGKSLYRVTSHGQNELILQWGEAVMLKVSAWTTEQD